MTTVKKFNGYMLGNQMRRPLGRGQQWWPYDSSVYVCPTLARAKELLAEDLQQPVLEPHFHFTTIYRVVANDIDVRRENDGLYWTKQATKLKVVDIVHEHPATEIPDWRLLLNADAIMAELSKKMTQFTK